MRKTASFSTLIIMIMRKALSSGKIESKIYILVFESKMEYTGFFHPVPSINNKIRHNTSTAYKTCKKFKYVTF